jgi:enoyl-CoA hydratase
MSDDVVITRSGSVLVITINRPDARNAINGAVADGIAAGAETLDSDPSLTVGVLTGAGGVFCAGMDLKAFATSGAPSGLGQFMRRGTEKPLIAAIEGFAYAGGLELALASDLIVAARGAKLAITEVRVGLLAAGGALIRLPRRLPPAVAMEMALTATPMLAEVAFQHGLVNRLTDVAGALDAALALAEQINANAPLAVRASKRVLQFAADHGERESWTLQRSIAADVFASQDAKEGPRAFAEKRPPNWSGR